MKQAVYINGMGCISPQETASGAWSFEAPKAPVEGDRFLAVEPDYKSFIPANALRRMGKVIRMGIAASRAAMQEAGIEQVDAITTGTGLGCLEDSERFLRSMTENEEQLLTPTAFIQSTHNTVAAQIALQLKCHAHNFTYVHRGFSFESALLDAMLLIGEGKKQVLAGGIDEQTSSYVDQLRKHQRIKPMVSGPDFWKAHTPGFQLGEGAAFYVLSSEKTSRSQALLQDLEMVYKPKSGEQLLQRVQLFLEEQHVLPDVILLGFCGDQRYDEKLQTLYKAYNDTTALGYFKHLCGEYHTAGAFGTWAATRILQSGGMPESLRCNDHPVKNIRTVLLVNGFLDRNYTLTLLTGC